MQQFRHSYKAALTLVGASVALVIGCSESVDPSIHGAPAVMVGPATQVQVAPSSTALNQGGRSLLRCVAFDAQGVMLSNAPIWTSSDPATATVSSDGSVTAIHSGTATATCQIGGRTAMSSITVSTAQVAFVEVSPGAGTIPTGSTLQFSGVPRDSLGFPVPGVSVQWTSQDPTIATVTSDGVVTAKTNGDADIVATSAGVAGMTKVKVTGVAPPPVASILLSVDQTSLSAGHFTFATATTLDANGQPLVGRAITWSTGDPTVLSAVVLNGTKAKVNARAKGTATVTATSEGKNATVTLNVGAPTVAVVAASLASSSIVVGQTTLASAIPEDGFGNPLSGHAVTWTSLDPTIATVSSSGVVTGVAPGAVIIRATSDGVTGDASLTVTAVPVASVTTTLSSSTVNVGQTTQGTAIARDAGGNMLTGRSVAWSSLNTAVATVSIAGLVTAIAPGNAVIRATVESSTGDATVVVNAPAAPTPPVGATANVVVTFDSSSIAKGHSSQAKATVRDGQGNVLSGKTPSWASVNTGVATVSSTGIVTGSNAGTAVVQATVDGVSASGSLAVMSSGTVPPPPTPPAVALVLNSGSYANPPYAIEATATVPVASIVFMVDGAVYRTETIARYCLFGGDATCAAGSLGAGAHAIQAKALDASGATIATSAVLNIVDGSTLSPVPPPTPTTPPPSGSMSANFEDGTLGPFSPTVSGAVDVVDDPTGGGHGKVARIHYSMTTPTGVAQDDNKAFQPALSLGLGQELWFQGDFYVAASPAITLDVSSFNIQRKLTYWSWANVGPHPIGFVITTFGPQFAVFGTGLGYASSGFQPGQGYIDTAVGYLTSGAWHRLKIHCRMNSTMAAADGIVQLWYDGKLIFDHSDARWTDPTWTDDPSTIQLHDFWTGEQVNAGLNVDEYRYWDNVIYSRTPIP